jgi:hypothetical protein
LWRKYEQPNEASTKTSKGYGANAKRTLKLRNLKVSVGGGAVIVKANGKKRSSFN